MRDDILKQALADCRKHQLRGEQEQRRRFDEVAARCPDIMRLHDERHRGILDSISVVARGGVPEGIAEATARLSNDITRLLVENDYPADYLDPVYHCPRCRDTGYAGEGKKTLCSCVLARSRELMSGARPGVRSQTFEQYDDSVFPDTKLQENHMTQRAYMREIRRICEAYADSVPHSETLNLFMSGSSGLGKTFLLNAIGARAAGRGVTTLQYTANDLLNRIRQAYFSYGQEDDSSLYSVQLLLIDDLGTEPMWENITVEQLFALIDGRLTMGKHTVISTNLTPGEMQARYTERIASRLFDRRTCQALRFLGADVRKR